MMVKFFAAFSILAALAISATALGAPGVPVTFTYQGVLTDSSDAVIANQTKTVVFSILDPSKTYILYQETQTVTTDVNGVFSTTVGTAPGSASRTGSDSGSSMSQVFSNAATAISAKLASNGSASTYTPTVNDGRYLRINLAGTDLAPDLSITSVPYSLQAGNSGTLQGLAPAAFIAVNGAAPASLTQANVENVFSTTNYPILTSLLSGTSLQYVQQAANGAVALPSFASTPASPAAGQMWYDSSGVLKFWDGSSVQTLGTAGSVSWSGISSKPTTLAGYAITDAVTNAGSTPSIQSGLDAAKPAFGTAGRLYVATDTAKIYTDTGAAWSTVASNSGAGLSAVSNQAPLSNGKVWIGDGTGKAQENILNGDVAITNIGVATVNGIKGVTVSAAPTSAGQVLRYNGTNLVPNFVSMFDLRSTVTGTQAFGGVGCLPNQTLTWTAAVDNLSCSNVSLPATQVTGTLPIANGGTGVTSLPGTFVLNGGQAGAVTLGSSDASAVNLNSNGATRITVLSNGNVGIGNASPGLPLDVAGQARFSSGLSSPNASAYDGSSTTVTYGAGSGTSNLITGQHAIVYQSTNQSMSMAYGMLGEVQSSTGNSNPISKAYGVVGAVGIGSSGSVMTSIAGVATGLSSGSGSTATNAYGLYVDTPNFAGSVTNVYGIYINPQGSSRYGLYQAGSLDKNLFSGKVGLGVIPTSALDVNGGISVGTGYAGIYPAPTNGLIVQGNVGVGTNSPSRSLDVSGNVSATYGGSGTGISPVGSSPALRVFNQSTSMNTTAYLELQAQNSTNTQTAYIGALSMSGYSPAMVFGTTSGSSTWSERMRIDSSGGLAIGATSASGYSLYVNGTAAGTASWANVSDRRLKKNIATVPDALAKVDELRGVSYEWRKDEFPDMKLGSRRELGVIAQEVEQVFPEAVNVSPSTGLRTVAYTMLISPLIEAVKELHQMWLGHDQEIKELKSSLEQVQNENLLLKQRLDEVERRLGDAGSK